MKLRGINHKLLKIFKNESHVYFVPPPKKNYDSYAYGVHLSYFSLSQHVQYKFKDKNINWE